MGKSTLMKILEVFTGLLLLEPHLTGKCFAGIQSRIFLANLTNHLLISKRAHIVLAYVLNRRSHRIVGAMTEGCFIYANPNGIRKLDYLCRLS